MQRRRIAGDEVVRWAGLGQREKVIIVRIRRSGYRRKRCNKHGGTPQGVDQPPGLVPPNPLGRQPGTGEAVVQPIDLFVAGEGS
jgi:hypothetical protein